MDITPLLPEGYDGEVVKLTCPQCDTRFSVTREYQIKQQPILCHACSIIFSQETDVDMAFRLLAEWNNKRPKGYRLFHRKEIETSQGKTWIVFLRKSLGQGHYHVVCDLLSDTTGEGKTYMTLTNFRKPYTV